MVEVQAGGDAAHVADLQVEDHEVGVDSATAPATAWPDRTRRQARALVGEGGLHLGEHGIGVGGDEDLGHGGEASAADRTRGGSPHGLASLAERPKPSPPGGRVLDIEVEDSTDYTLCRPVGELDAYTVSQFREALGGLSNKQYLLIDLSAVPFMDSAGLGALIGGIRRAREAGGDVAVACSRPTLTRLLHTTGFDRIVSVTETVDDAAAALADARPAT